MALAMTTLEPSDSPINRLIIRLVSGTLEPTAAMARVPWSPEKLPMMTVAMRFDSCSRMLVAATGKANRGILRHSEPVVMSMCLDAVSVIRSQSLTCSFVLICADDDTPIGQSLSYLILRISCTRSAITMGLDKKPFMPLSKALRRSSSKAFAVIARMGMPARAGFSSSRMRRVAV